MGQQWAAPFVYLGPLSPGAYTGRGLSGRSYVLCLMAIEYETRLPIPTVVGRFGGCGWCLGAGSVLASTGQTVDKIVFVRMVRISMGQ